MEAKHSLVEFELDRGMAVLGVLEKLAFVVGVAACMGCAASVFE
jgi:hypothetical protein